MRYSKAQLNAISRSYAQKRAQQIRAELERLGVFEYFDEQTIYQTERGFLNAIKRGDVSALVGVWKRWTARSKDNDITRDMLKKHIEKLARVIQQYGGEEFAHFGY